VVLDPPFDPPEAEAHGAGAEAVTGAAQQLVGYGASASCEPSGQSNDSPFTP